MKDSVNTNFVYPNEYEKASNSYLMSTVCVIAGLPLPIINVLASLGYYVANRKASYFVRWHCIQSIISQAIILPFNSILLAWTISFLWTGFYDLPYIYLLYLFVVLFLNLAEFLCVLITAARVRNGHNVRWPLIAAITDKLTSAGNRDIYRL